jgi:uncharacterized membrane protein HdeD (DUF308 family)
MSFRLPVALPYAIGVVLVVFGSLRAIHLGWQRRDRVIDEEELGRSKTPRYHIMWGVLWVVMGLFLVISTFIQSRR